MKNYDLKKRVMRRIYVIYVQNFVLQNGIYITIVAILCFLVASVSVADIARNMPKNDLVSLSNFLVAAFINTETAIQATIGLFALCSLAPLFRLGFKATKKSFLRSPALQA